MSAFDIAIDCTRGMVECLNQNFYETPPYGPLPDATRKLRTALSGMLDALIIAQSAESQGILMPPVPEMPEVEVEGLKALVRHEHTLHREHADALAKQEGAADTLTQWRPQTSTDQELFERAKQEEARKQQAESARLRQLEDNRGREEALRQQAQDRTEQEKAEHDRQSQAQQEHDRLLQTRGQQPIPPGTQGPHVQPVQPAQSEEDRQRHDRERQDRERHARESAEHERQFVSQAQAQPQPPRE